MVTCSRVTCYLGLTQSVEVRGIDIRANPTVLRCQVNSLLLRFQLSTGSRLHLSIVVFDWTKEPQELHSCV